MADKMRFNHNNEISMFNKGGYEAYAVLIIILLRIAKKCKPSRILTTKFCRKYEKKKVVSYYNYKMALIKISIFSYANSPSTQFHHPCNSLFFHRDHLRSNMGIISGRGSFAVQFGDHLRFNLGIICGPGIIYGSIWGSFADPYSSL